MNEISHGIMNFLRIFDCYTNKNKNGSLLTYLYVALGKEGTALTLVEDIWKQNRKILKTIKVCEY